MAVNENNELDDLTAIKGRSLADMLRDACAKPRTLIQPLAGCEGKFLDRAGKLLRPQIVGAQRFVFDDGATALAASMGAMLDPLDDGRSRMGLDWDAPAMLLAAMPRCRAPYENTWIEWPHRTRISGAGYEVAPDCVEQSGMFIEKLPGYDARYRITTVSPAMGAYSGKAVYVLPISLVYDLTRDIDTERPEEHYHILDIVESAIGNSCNFNIYVMGGTFNRATACHDADSIEACRLITKRTMLTWSPYTGYRMNHTVSNKLDGEDFSPENPRFELRGSSVREPSKNRAAYDLALAFEETMGDFRFALAVMALLNSKAQSTVRWTGASIGSAQLPKNSFSRRYLSHTKVTLAVPREQAVQTLGTAYGFEFGRRRRHPVRGSWCHGRTGARAGNPNCSHEYDTSDPLKHQCRKCGALRWWRAEHERGDASIGYVTHDYEITTATR